MLHPSQYFLIDDLTFMPRVCVCAWSSCLFLVAARSSSGRVEVVVVATDEIGLAGGSTIVETVDVRGAHLAHPHERGWGCWARCERARGVGSDEMVEVRGAQRAHVHACGWDDAVTRLEAVRTAGLLACAARARVVASRIEVNMVPC